MQQGLDTWLWQLMTVTLAIPDSIHDAVVERPVYFAVERAVVLWRNVK